MLIDVNEKKFVGKKPGLIRILMCWFGFHKYRRMRYISRNGKRKLGTLIMRCKYCESRKPVDCNI